MPISYDDFRGMTWAERVSHFSDLSEEGKAELFRSQVSGWLSRHAAELTPEQIALLEEAIELTVPEIYKVPKSDTVAARLKEFEQRARALLTPAQALEALTMQWGPDVKNTCSPARRP